MNWNLEGLRVSGRYLNEVEVIGTVELSRVKYGGEISHLVLLDVPTVVFGTARDRVVLEHDLVEQVFD